MARRGEIIYIRLKTSNAVRKKCPQFIPFQKYKDNTDIKPKQTSFQYQGNFVEMKVDAIQIFEDDKEASQRGIKTLHRKTYRPLLPMEKNVPNSLSERQGQHRSSYCTSIDHFNIKQILL